MAENCTGHNGNPKTYATVIYSNNTSNPQLMNDIISALQIAYHQQKKSDQTLKEITDNYLENTITISKYQDGIIGTFNLYTSNDPHCCPSYNGTYRYDINKKAATIDIRDNIY